ncbi:uncharacterized protein LOC113464821 isoform X2 [Ceratina calcarata]|uniref:Uncharacterized protein LOC113464821 isoform X2 n=1 Tax=Ceratina calcarata TaxID=156304 RepID=A0AAJ7S7I8_9HYME|nr:uncharacterized protein LOC113464821 isoform X2 [Ceratina calcarata]
MDKITKNEQDHEEPNEESFTKDVYNDHSPRAKETDSNCKLRRKSSRVINATSQRNYNQKDARSRSRSRSRSPCIRNSKKWISSNPFINFVQDIRQSQKYCGLRSSKIHQMAGERWRNMSSTEKQPYIKGALNIKNQKLNQKNENINEPAEINADQPKKEDTPKQEKTSKREGKKKEPKKSTREKSRRTKSNTESDTESMTSATSLTNTSDDASDTGS